jgi:hypothetical protein
MPGEPTLQRHESVKHTTMDVDTCGGGDDMSVSSPSSSLSPSSGSHSRGASLASDLQHRRTLSTLSSASSSSQQSHQSSRTASLHGDRLLAAAHAQAEVANSSTSPTSSTLHSRSASSARSSVMSSGSDVFAREIASLDSGTHGAVDAYASLQNDGGGVNGFDDVYNEVFAANGDGDGGGGDGGDGSALNVPLPTPLQRAGSSEEILMLLKEKSQQLHETPASADVAAAIVSYVAPNAPGVEAGANWIAGLTDEDANKEARTRDDEAVATLRAKRTAMTTAAAETAEAEALLATAFEAARAAHARATDAAAAVRATSTTGVGGLRHRKTMSVLLNDDDDDAFTAISGGGVGDGGGGGGLMATMSSLMAMRGPLFTDAGESAALTEARRLVRAADGMQEARTTTVEAAATAEMARVNAAAAADAAIDVSSVRAILGLRSPHHSAALSGVGGVGGGIGGGGSVGGGGGVSRDISVLSLTPVDAVAATANTALQRKLADLAERHSILESAHAILKVQMEEATARLAHVDADGGGGGGGDGNGRGCSAGGRHSRSGNGRKRSSKAVAKPKATPEDVVAAARKDANADLSQREVSAVSVRHDLLSRRVAQAAIDDDDDDDNDGGGGGGGGGSGESGGGGGDGDGGVGDDLMQKSAAAAASSSVSGDAAEKLGAHKSLLEDSRFVTLVKRTGVPKEKDADDTPTKAVVVKKPKGMAVARLLDLIRDTWDAKAAVDTAARRDAAAVAALPEFVSESLRKKFGLPSIVADKTWTLLASCAKHRDCNQDVELFSQFLEESRSLDELGLFLRTRAVVHQMSAGVRYPGDVHRHRAAAVAGEDEHDDDGGGEEGDRRPRRQVDEYICMRRAQAAVDHIFPATAASSDAAAASSVSSIRVDLFRAVADIAVPWAAVGISDADVRGLASSVVRRRHGVGVVMPVADKKGLGDADARCVRLSSFLEKVLIQFREIELKMRHNTWARDLFTAVDTNHDGWIDFRGFARIFTTTHPKFSQREVAQLFTNITRNAGTQQLNLQCFKHLSLQLMNDGVIFPGLGQHSSERSRRVVQVIIQHWGGFKTFFAEFHRKITLSGDAADAECAKSLSTIAYMLNREFVHGSRARRLTTLYRALLFVVASHQATAQLRGVEVPPDQLHDELLKVESVIAHNDFLLRHGDEMLEENKANVMLTVTTATAGKKLANDSHVDVSDSGGGGGGAKTKDPTFGFGATLPSVTSIDQL